MHAHTLFSNIPAIDSYPNDNIELWYIEFDQFNIPHTAKKTAISCLKKKLNISQSWTEFTPLLRSNYNSMTIQQNEQLYIGNCVCENVII